MKSEKIEIPPATYLVDLQETSDDPTVFGPCDHCADDPLPVAEAVAVLEKMKAEHEWAFADRLTEIKERLEELAEEMDELEADEEEENSAEVAALAREFSALEFDVIKLEGENSWENRNGMPRVLTNSAGSVALIQDQLDLLEDAEERWAGGYREGLEAGEDEATCLECAHAALYTC